VLSKKQLEKAIEKIKRLTDEVTREPPLKAY
jgi:hypothetical protein